MVENTGYVFPDDRQDDVVETKKEEQGGNPGAQEASATAKVIPDPKEVFGSENYKSWDDVKAALETGATTAQELDKLRLAKEELEGKVQAFTNPFANDELAKMNEFAKKNPDKPLSLLTAITAATVDTADPIEVLVTEKIFSNPKYLGQEDVLREHFKEAFGIDETEQDPKKKQLALLRMDEAVGVAKTKLGTVLKDLTPALPDATKSASDKEAIAAKWTGHLSGVKWDSIPIPMQEGDNLNAEFVKFGLTDELKQSIFTQMTDFAKAKGMDLTTENIQTAFKQVYPSFVTENLPKIILAAVQKAQTMDAEEQHKILNYPSGLLKNTERKTEAPQGYNHLFE